MAADEELTSARGPADADPSAGGGEADRLEVTWNRREEFDVSVLHFAEPIAT